MENNETTTPEVTDSAAAPKRRVSRRVSVAAGSAADSQPVSGADAAPAASAAEGAEQPAAPKRRGRKSKAQLEAEAAAAAAAGDAAPAAASDASAAAAEGAEQSAAPKRRGRKSKAQLEAEAAAAAAAGDAAPAAASDASAAVTEGAEQPAAPKRRGRKSKAQLEAEAAAKAAAEQEQAGEQPAAKAEQDAADKQEGDAQAEEKPKRTRTRGGRTAEQGEKEGGQRRRGQSANGESQDAAESAEGEQTEKQEGDESQKQERREGRTRTRQRDRKRRGDDIEPDITEDDVLLPVAGILDVLDNFAFVRTSGYLPGTGDVYVSLGMVKKHGLRRGDAIVGAIRQPREGEGNHRQKYNALVKLDSVNGQPVQDEQPKRVDFQELTPLFAEGALQLAGKQWLRDVTASAPIALGQRVLVSHPTLVSGVQIAAELAAAVSQAAPEAHLMFVTTNEQPERVTALQRSVRGEVVAATFEMPLEDQLTVAELSLDRARRLVELGHDVVVVLDSLSDVADAYLASAQLSRGGSENAGRFAMTQLRKLFAAGRNLENAGSLTLVAFAREGAAESLDAAVLRELTPFANTVLRVAGDHAAQELDKSASYTMGA